MALKPEILKWFYEVQKQLKERFDLDTSRKEDMGRFKVAHFYKKTEDGGQEPLAYGEPIDDIDMIEVENAYATAKRDDSGRGYAEPMPESANERLEWMQNVQRTFRVTEGEDGTLTMDSEMSDEELMRLYNEAKDGRLNVSKPDGDLRVNDGSGMFLCVSKDGMPVFCDTAFADIMELSAEQLNRFYGNRPELLDKPLRDEDVLMQARIDLTDLNRLEDPHAILGRMNVALQNIQSNSRDGVNPYMPMYEHLAWQQLHEYVQPAPYRQFVITESDIPNALGRKGVDDAFLSGKGLEKFFVMSKDGTKPLFPDHEELKREFKTNRLCALSEFHRRLGDAALSGNLTYCAPDPENAGQYKGFRVVEGRRGTFDVKALPAQRPDPLPWYKRWFSAFFREEVAKYRQDTAAYEHFEQMKPMYEEAASRIQPEEPEKKIPDPVKEARKAKLAKMTPEERFEYDLAENIYECYENISNARIYLKIRNSKVEDVQKDNSFREFLKTPRVQGELAKRLRGESAAIGMMAMDYMREVAEAAEQKLTGQKEQEAPSAADVQQAVKEENAPEKDAPAVKNAVPKAPTVTQK